MQRRSKSPSKFSFFTYHCENDVGSCRVATVREKSGKNKKFFKVREFCKKSGKISVLVKVSEKSGNFDELATEAETKHKMDLLVKLNALRSKSREKRKEIEHKDKNIDGLQKKLKLM